MATETERPDWLTEGAQVYSISQDPSRRSHDVARRTVQRFTATQVVVTTPRGGFEERYRLPDLYLVGAPRYSRGSRQLVPGTDPRVQEELDKAATRRAMAPLTEVFNELNQQARINTDNPTLAMEYATRVRAAADRAIQALQSSN
jgi:hypothetical protein